MQKNAFSHKTLVPRNLLKEKKTRIGPSESWRPDDSENVELIGRVRFWTGVIGRQRWMSPKKLLRHRKYEALQKNNTPTILSFDAWNE